MAEGGPELGALQTVGTSHVQFQYRQLAREVGTKPVTIVPPRVSQECPGLQSRSPDSLPDLGVWAGVHSIRPGSGETRPLSLPLGGGRLGGLDVMSDPPSPSRGACSV